MRWAASARWADAGIALAIVWPASLRAPSSGFEPTLELTALFFENSCVGIVLAAVLVSLVTGAAALGVASPVSVAAVPLPASTQAAATVGPAAEADSGRALGAAREAQREFEQLRRKELPWTWERGSGPCDEIIGRFCLWHDGDDDWEPPAQSVAVTAARERLIEGLRRAAAHAPGDAWIAGQRVRYLIEAGRGDEAEATARDCQTERWWCLALEGYTLHYAGRFEAAESAFAVALVAMPGSQQRRWQDISVLLEPGGRGRYRSLREEERPRFAERFWRLADPLYLVSGNERRTEHYARLVLDRLQEDSRSPFGVPWGWDLREILLRYGWPAGWERVQSSAGAPAGPVPVVSHFQKGGLQFVPPAEFVLDPASIRSDDWRLDPPRPRAEFAVPYASSFTFLEHQLARFRRGDSAVIVAAYDLRVEELENRRAGTGSERRIASQAAGADHETRAALVVLDREGVPTAAVQARGRGRSGGLTATAAPGPALVSIEVLVPEERRAARARYAVSFEPQAAGPMASDLLVVEPHDPLPRTLAAAAGVARGSTRVKPGERIGIYFELYGLPPATVAATLALSVVPRREGWMQRAARRLGLASEPSPLVLRWNEEVTGGRLPWGRTLAIDLPELPRGAHELRLEVTLPTLPERPAISASRRIHVEP